MTLKVVIGNKGKAWKLELENSVLNGKSIADKIHGKDLRSELDGYEFEITGGSDFAGFPMTGNVEGIGLKKVLLKKGWGMRDSRKGVRLRKTVRGKTISDDSVQINMKILKEGSKKMGEVFTEQNVQKGEEEKKISEKTDTDGSEADVKEDKKVEDKKADAKIEGKTEEK